MTLEFTFLWTLAPVAIAFFFVGVYKNVVSRLAYLAWVNTPGRDGDIYRDTRVRLGFPSLRTMVNEALLQRRIKNRSTYLWIRHMLIFFGFVPLLAFDLLSFILGKFLHKYAGLEYFALGAGKAFLKVGLEASGTVLFIGLTLALVHRIVFAKEESKCVDLKMILLLWVVVTSGFLAEIFRFVAAPIDPFRQYSFIAGPVAEALAVLPWTWLVIERWMWLAHVGMALFFFGYIPHSKLVHTLVAPIGRSVTMGQDTAKLKMEKVSEAWL